MQLLTFLLPLTFLLNFAHPFFVSICEIKHNQEEATLELTVKMFSDDLEKTLESKINSKINLGTENEHKDTAIILEKYLINCIALTLNGKSIELEYLGKEVEMDATWIYLEAKEIGEINSIKVKNTLLFDYQTNQTNIVHLLMNGIKKSMILTKDMHSQEIKI